MFKLNLENMEIWFWSEGGNSGELCCSWKELARSFSQFWKPIYFRIIEDLFARIFRLFNSRFSCFKWQLMINELIFWAGSFFRTKICQELLMIKLKWDMKQHQSGSWSTTTTLFPPRRQNEFVLIIN